MEESAGSDSAEFDGPFTPPKEARRSSPRASLQFDEDDFRVSPAVEAVASPGAELEVPEEFGPDPADEMRRLEKLEWLEQEKRRAAKEEKAKQKKAKLRERQKAERARQKAERQNAAQPDPPDGAVMGWVHMASRHGLLPSRSKRQRREEEEQRERTEEAQRAAADAPPPEVPPSADELVAEAEMGWRRLFAQELTKWEAERAAELQEALADFQARVCTRLDLMVSSFRRRSRESVQEVVEELVDEARTELQKFVEDCGTAPVLHTPPLVAGVLDDNADLLDAVESQSIESAEQHLAMMKKPWFLENKDELHPTFTNFPVITGQMHAKLRAMRDQIEQELEAAEAAVAKTAIVAQQRAEWALEQKRFQRLQTRAESMETQLAEQRQCLARLKDELRSKQRELRSAEAAKHAPGRRRRKPSTPSRASRAHEHAHQDQLRFEQTFPRRFSPTKNLEPLFRRHTL